MKVVKIESELVNWHRAKKVAIKSVDRIRKLLLIGDHRAINPQGGHVIPMTPIICVAVEKLCVHVPLFQPQKPTLWPGDPTLKSLDAEKLCFQKRTQYLSWADRHIMSIAASQRAIISNYTRIEVQYFQSSDHSRIEVPCCSPLKFDISNQVITPGLKCLVVVLNLVSITKKGFPLEKRNSMTGLLLPRIPPQPTNILESKVCI